MSPDEMAGPVEPQSEWSCGQGGLERLLLLHQASSVQVADNME